MRRETREVDDSIADCSIVERDALVSVTRWRMEVRSGSFLLLFLGGVWEAGSSCAVVMVELLGGRKGTTYHIYCLEAMWVIRT